MPIECKVAQILSEEKLVINAGSEKGVEEGMIFDIMGMVTIKDPDSDELLDEIPFTKISVKASLVRPKVTVAETLRKYSRSYFVDILNFQESYKETFDYVQGEDVDQRDLTVYVGDIAREYVKKSSV